MILTQVLLLHWSSDALLEEWSHFLGLVPMMSMRDENLTGVPEVLMSDMGRAGGGGVQAQSVELLSSTGEATDREAWELSSPGVVLSEKTSTLSFAAVASTTSMEHAGATPGLSVVEKNQMSSLNESDSSTWVRTFLTMVSCCSHIMASWSSCLSASFSFHLTVSSWNWSIILSVSFSTLAEIWLISLLWVAISSSSSASCSCCLQSSCCSS